MRSAVAILPFEGRSPLANEFLAFARSLYASDRRWIPEIGEDTRRAMAGNHPLGQDLIQRHFLAQREGRTVARASAFVNRQVDVNGGPLGTIGRFEAREDPEAVSALFVQAGDWLASLGVKVVWGPMNGSIWQAYRLMVSGFDDLPFLGEPYNKPYYADLLIHAGFVGFKRWTTHFLPLSTLETIVAATKKRHDALLSTGYRFRSFTPESFESDLKVLHRLISDSFSGFAGFHPLGLERFVELYGGLKRLVQPELARFLLDPDAQEVGYMVMFPDPSKGLRAMTGRTDWIAKARYLLSQGRPELYLALYLGITESEQQRRSHAGAALAHASALAGLRDGVPIASALMADRSPARYWSGHLPHRAHHYALYRKVLDSSADPPTNDPRS